METLGWLGVQSKYTVFSKRAWLPPQADLWRGKILLVFDSKTFCCCATLLPYIMGTISTKANTDNFLSCYNHDSNNIIIICLLLLFVFLVGYLFIMNLFILMFIIIICVLCYVLILSCS